MKRYFKISSRQKERKERKNCECQLIQLWKTGYKYYEVGKILGKNKYHFGLNQIFNVCSICYAVLMIKTKLVIKTTLSYPPQYKS